jgi:signal transduction histidine kinase
VGTLAAGVAHEINNPLAYMLLNAEQLRDAFDRWESTTRPDVPLETLRLCADMIYDGTKRVQRIVGELLEFAKPVGPVEPVNVQEVIELSLEFTRRLCERRARISTHWGEVPCILAHHERLAQVFIHLLTNAAEAIPPDAEPDNAVSVSTHREGANSVCVEVRDTGSGIRREDAPHLFEPFFTTKENGTGLGLAICQRIVRSLNGEIRVDAVQPRGTVFRVVLPLAP